MLIFRIIIFIGLLTALTSCWPLKHEPEESANPLTGFQIMNNPRSSVPVGAIWIKNYGPNGAGVDNSEIEKVHGSGTYTYSSYKNAHIAANLAKMFGASVTGGEGVTFELKGIEVYRVKNIFSSQVKVGENVLFEALKAKSINIISGAGVSATITSRLQYDNIPFKISASGSGTKIISLDGVDLFIAYRLVTFSPLDYSSYNVLVDGGASHISMMSHGYRFSVDGHSLYECACSNKIALNLCLKQPLSIKITEPYATSVDGTPWELSISHRPASDWTDNYSLGKSTDRETKVGTAYRTRFLNLDLRNVISLEAKPGEPECEVRFGPGDGGTITEVNYELKPFVDPNGW